jgi:hypothetical protein
MIRLDNRIKCAQYLPRALALSCERKIDKCFYCSFVLMSGPGAQVMVDLVVFVEALLGRC